MEDKKGNGPSCETHFASILDLHAVCKQEIMQGIHPGLHNPYVGD